MNHVNTTRRPPRLVLIRGLPGSGKSTMARAMPGYEHVEADHWFERTGVYRFDGSKIADAHAWCLRRTRIMLELQRRVVVSNTFTRLWELQPYLSLVEDALVIVATGRWKSVHGVSEQALQKMRERWEPFFGERSISRSGELVDAPKAFA